MLNRARHLTHWSLLLVLSVAVGWPIVHAGIGAGALVGPMLAGIAMGMSGTRIGISGRAFVLAQGVLGCMIASMLEASVLDGVAAHFGAMAAAVVLTLVGATATGWVLTRTGTMPGSTGAWGSLPGAAAAMVTMSAAFGGDPRMVAVMQYLRVMIVILAATAVSHYAVTEGAPGGQIAMLAAAKAQPSVSASTQICTILIAVAASWLGWASRVPAGALLLPIVVGGALQISGVMTLAMPHGVVVLALATLGWSIGLRFKRDLIAPMLRALPTILLGIVALLLLCTLAAWLLTLLAPVSMLTAYLATSPGGLDSVAVLALEANADMPFVVAFQTLRLFAVVLVGPFLGRWLARGAPLK
ncbi:MULTISPECIES: AbrB family transcriptional regulator [unclassified Bordetella]|uniref:AbrB family transcriptional regulator n=1 Tax=unclassified Bordetella TaxID=2630031 RepID=UPI001365B029|nr:MULTISPECIES: AbrB family transcriptional regulator [unclassified Bordetella]